MKLRCLTLRDVLRRTGLLLVLPFLLMSLVAPGFMPGRASDGTMTLVICADGLPVEIVVDAVTGQPVQKQAPEDGRCDWAQAVQAVALLTQPVLPSPVRLAGRFTPVATDDLWRPAHDPRGLWARGPPATV